LAEVDDFHVVARRIERGGDVLFGSNTHGATRVVEYSFGFHVRFLLLCLDLFYCGTRRDCRMSLVNYVTGRRAR
jgi:hypothetical protein